MSTMTAEDFYNAIPSAVERLAQDIKNHLIDSRLDQLSTQIRDKFSQFADATDLNSNLTKEQCPPIKRRPHQP